MFVYFNYRKSGGLTSYTAFNKEEKLSSYLVEELKNLAKRNVEDYPESGSTSKQLEKYFASLRNPKIPQLREAINKYEEWATPYIGPAVLHDIKELNIIKECAPR